MLSAPPPFLGGPAASEPCSQLLLLVTCTCCAQTAGSTDTMRCALQRGISHNPRSSRCSAPLTTAELLLLPQVIGNSDTESCASQCGNAYTETTDCCTAVSQLGTSCYFKGALPAASHCMPVHVLCCADWARHVQQLLPQGCAACCKSLHACPCAVMRGLGKTCAV